MTIRLEPSCKAQQCSLRGSKKHKTEHPSMHAKVTYDPRIMTQKWSQQISRIVVIIIHGITMPFMFLRTDSTLDEENRTSVLQAVSSTSLGRNTDEKLMLRRTRTQTSVHSVSTDSESGAAATPARRDKAWIALRSVHCTVNAFSLWLRFAGSITPTP